MKNDKKCRYCKVVIHRARVPNRIGGRVWRWRATTNGSSFYCPQAGGDCWHEPERMSCEKCWEDAYVLALHSGLGQTAEYARLLEEHHCTPAQQRGGNQEYSDASMLEADQWDSERVQAALGETEHLLPDEQEMYDTPDASTWADVCTLLSRLRTLREQLASAQAKHDHNRTFIKTIQSNFRATIDRLCAVIEGWQTRAETAEAKLAAAQRDSARLRALELGSSKDKP